MIGTSSLYQACADLFADYPQAVESGGSVRWMVLVQQVGLDARFFVLMRDHDEGHPLYSLSPWRAPGGVDIGPDTDAAVPEEAASAITRGVPIPRHGSLFGWDDGGAIIVLIAAYAQYTSATPEPSWATMPLAGISETRWPEFVGERFFGRWFWELYRAGNVIALNDLITATPGVVFWVDTVAILGSGCCAVAHDITSPEGPVLQRGRYVYYQVLQAGRPVPSLEALLADDNKIDLTPRFLRPRQGEGMPQDGR
jgi:hypothetical protein